MKIKSITDVITNSSSETFVISYPKMDAKELQDLLKEYCQDSGDRERGCSGCAGVIEVKTLQNKLKHEIDYFGEHCSPREKAYRYGWLWLPDSLVIEIDFNYQETIKFLREYCPEAYSIEEETWYPVYDETGENLLRITSDYREWMNLPSPYERHGSWAVSEMDWWNFESK